MYTNNSNIFSRRRGDSMLTNTMKEDLTQGLVDLFSDSILAIILYGSVARNDNTDESDIDIVIIIKNEMDICCVNNSQYLMKDIVRTV